MWRWVVFFLFLLKKQQHLEHKKITSEPAAAHGFLPTSVDCTHPKGRPPSTLRTLEAVGSVCRESHRKQLLYCTTPPQGPAEHSGDARAWLDKLMGNCELGAWVTT